MHRIKPVIFRLSLERIMTRQQALNKIWNRLLIIFGTLILLGAGTSLIGDDVRVPALLFIFGNIGSYVAFHRDLRSLQDEKIIEFSSSWLGLVVPSLVGGILAIILYILFLSGIIRGDLFPEFVPDFKVREGFDAVFDQHGKDGMKDYAKLRGFDSGSTTRGRTTLNTYGFHDSGSDHAEHLWIKDLC